MSRRKALDIKKKILGVLNEKGEMSLRKLDIQVNTSSQTIKDQIKELEFFDKVLIIKHTRNRINGRPYTTVKLKH